MTTATSERSIFLAALELPSPAERAAYLKGACGANLSLLANVQGLLAAHEQSDDFLNRPPDLGTIDYQPLAEGPGSRIGPYKLLQQIGAGGMGVVYMAEQEQPVRRKVALKIVKPGMDTREVIARFESERQALALMDHPNIARVFDAGATDSGRPYFVMELVKGVPVTEFCDKNHMPAGERLQLFLAVCRAVQHAHHKGIIHRDLKPSNVMVTLHDGVPVVKVIDFGVAKATAQKLTEKTLFTAYGQMVGTPAYMSPEQAEMSGLDIDTRSDVYALGVLLYELLTGTTPLDAKRLRQAGFAEIQRLIREEEAPRPSTRLSSLGGAATVLANNRGTDARQLARLLRSDLDWIVMKALEKDRNRRYGSPDHFAADVERYVREQPVEARPPSAWYRFRKLARRNKVALTTAALVAVALLLGTAVSVWQAVRANAERDRAEAEKASAQATLRFLLAEVLEQAGPQREPDRHLTVRALLDKVTARLEAKTDLPALTEAAVRQTAGRIYWNLGEYKKGESLLAQAYELQCQHAGDAADTLDAAFYLAGVYRSQSDFASAEPLLRRVLDWRRRRNGADHRDTLRAVDVLAQIHNYRVEFERAEALYVPALEASRRAYGDQDPITLRLMFGLGATYSYSGGRPDLAEPLLARALKGQQAVLPDKHPEALSTQGVLSGVLFQLNRLPEAEREARQAFEKRREVYGERHPITFPAQAWLIQVYLAQGRRDAAAPLVRDLLDNARRQPERMLVFVLESLAEVGHALLRVRDVDSAEPFFQLTLDLAAKQFPDDRPRFADAVSGLGACRLGREQYAEAEPLLLQGYEGLRRHDARIPACYRHTRLTEAVERLVRLYDGWGKPDEAAKWRKELGTLGP